MNRDIILNKGKFIVFRKDDDSIPLSYSKNKNLFNNKNSIILPGGKNIRYFGCKNNNHHFTTKYHRDVVLPALNNLINLNFDINSFKLVSKIVDGYDFSYLSPIDTNYKFNVNCLNVKYNSILSYDEMCSCKVFGENKTPYHTLFYGAHACSITENLYKNNGKSIFISCDSQLIPSLGVICSTFKYVYAFDNRFCLNNTNILKSMDFDYYLVNLYLDDIEIYLTRNIR